MCSVYAGLSHLSEYHGHKHALCCHYLVGSSRHTSCEESVEFRGCELQRGRGTCLDISYMHDVHILAEQAAIHTVKFTHHWPRNGMLGRLRACWQAVLWVNGITLSPHCFCPWNYKHTVSNIRGRDFQDFNLMNKWHFFYAMPNTIFLITNLHIIVKICTTHKKNLL